MHWQLDAQMCFAIMRFQCPEFLGRIKVLISSLMGISDPTK